MPNWACGTVEVTGMREGIISFIERFVDWNESVVPGKRFFARSFIDEGRDEVTGRLKRENHGQPADTRTTFSFDVSFAWSAYTCLVCGYPQNNPEELMTLEDACREDRVCVRIFTEEPGICFEENLQCDTNGNITYHCDELLPARCRHCGETQCVSSHADLDEVECCECGELGFDYVNEEEAE